MRLEHDLVQPHVVEIVGLTVHGEEMDGHLAGLGQLAQTRDECVTVGLGHVAFANVSKHGQKLTGVLTMLLGEVADHRVEFLPHQRFGDKAFRIKTGTGIPFTAGDEFRCGFDEVAVAAGYRDRRQLKQISGQHDLDAAERPWIATDLAADLVNHVKQPGVQHGDLVNDENIRGLNLAFAAGFDELEQTGGQTCRHTHATP